MRFSFRLLMAALVASLAIAAAGCGYSNPGSGASPGASTSSGSGY